jgi:hypothetical protein
MFMTSSCFSCHHAARTWSHSTTDSIEPSLLVSPLLGCPERLSPFLPALHLHQRKSSRNLCLQYSAKNKSWPRCQTLITKEQPSTDPLTLRSSISPLMSALTTHKVTSSEKKRKKWKKSQTSDQKPKKAKNKITWRSKSRSPKARCSRWILVLHSYLLHFGLSSVMELTHQLAH